MSRPPAYCWASASSSAPPGRSNSSSTLEAFTLERRPCGLSTWKEAGACASTVPTFRSPSSSYNSCTAELEDPGQVLREALQAVIAALDHDLLRPGVAGDRLAAVEHLVAGLDQQEVASRRDTRHVKLLPFAQVRLREDVGLAGMQVLLRSEIGAQADMRLDGRIDQHRARVVLLREVGSVEAAQRRSDEAGRRRQALLDFPDGVAGERRQRRAGVLPRHAALGHVTGHNLRLVGMRRGIK